MDYFVDKYKVKEQMIRCTTSSYILFLIYIYNVYLKLFATKKFLYLYQSVLFYVISDDIKAAKNTLRMVNEGRNYSIVFPGARSYGIKAHAPGIIFKNINGQM